LTVEVVPGRSDGQFEEIVAGLQEGEMVAVTNAFALKMELMKASAED